MSECGTPEPLSVKVPKAAAMMDVSESTVRRLIAAGELDARRTSEPSGDWVITVASIKSWLGVPSERSTDTTEGTEGQS